MARGKETPSADDKSKGNNDGDGGATATTPSRKTEPRDYVVCRELTVNELVELVNKPLADGETREFERDAKVLVELGPAQGRTPREARIDGAKRYVAEDALKTDKGVELNAVPARALNGGKGTVKMSLNPTFEA